MVRNALSANVTFNYRYKFRPNDIARLFAAIRQDRYEQLIEHVQRGGYKPSLHRAFVNVARRWSASRDLKSLRHAIPPIKWTDLENMWYLRTYKSVTENLPIYELGLRTADNRAANLILSHKEMLALARDTQGTKLPAHIRAKLSLIPIETWHHILSGHFNRYRF